MSGASEHFDSRLDTREHIDRVRSYMRRVLDDWLDRMECHDATKLEEPELSGFDTYTPKLREMEYGSGEYKRAVDEMAPFIQHHYQHNSHHPEHYPDGLDGMDLVDLLEMLCDWKAGGERHATNPGIGHSININMARFNYGSQLAAILKNTAERYLDGPQAHVASVKGSQT